jgi:hypothetical protein
MDFVALCILVAFLYDGKFCLHAALFSLKDLMRQLERNRNMLKEA